MTNEEIIDKVTLIATNLRTAVGHVKFADKLRSQIIEKEEGESDQLMELYEKDDDYRAAVDDIERYSSEIADIVE